MMQFTPKILYYVTLSSEPRTLNYLNRPFGSAQGPSERLIEKSDNFKSGFDHTDNPERLGWFFFK
jgi:hypothetical protein